MSHDAVFAMFVEAGLGPEVVDVIEHRPLGYMCADEQTTDIIPQEYARDFQAARDWTPGARFGLGTEDLGRFKCRLCYGENRHEPSCPVAPVELPYVPGVVFTDWLAVALQESPAPTLLRRTDGECLIVRGLMHDLHGDAEDGKTMLALAATAQVLNDGGTVLLVDFESPAVMLRDRLRMLRVSDQVMWRRFLRAELSGDFDAETQRALRDLCIARGVELVVVDSFAELLGTHGADENSNADASAFYGLLRRTFTPSGAAVLVIDQVGHDQNRARGASVKKFELDVSLHLRKSRPFSSGRAGYSTIVLAKDRASVLSHLGVKGEAVGEMHVTPVGDGMSTVEVRPPSVRVLPVGKSHDALWDEIGDHVASVGTASGSAVASALHKSKQAVLAACRAMEGAGLLVDGPGGWKLAE